MIRATQYGYVAAALVQEKKIGLTGIPSPNNLVLSVISLYVSKTVFVTGQ